MCPVVNLLNVRSVVWNKNLKIYLDVFISIIILRRKSIINLGEGNSKLPATNIQFTVKQRIYMLSLDL